METWYDMVATYRLRPVGSGSCTRMYRRDDLCATITFITACPVLLEPAKKSRTVSVPLVMLNVDCEIAPAAFLTSTFASSHLEHFLASQRDRSLLR